MRLRRIFGGLFVLAEASIDAVRSDLQVKSLLYARAGIPEYWLLDVTSRRVVLHRLPRETGTPTYRPLGRRYRHSPGRRS